MIRLGDRKLKTPVEIHFLEDLFGLQAYLKAVNSFYSQFDWYDKKIDAKKLIKSKFGIDNNESLGTRLEKYFKSVFKTDFSKYEISVYIADNINSIDMENEGYFLELFRDINQYFKKSEIG